MTHPPEPVTSPVGGLSWTRSRALVHRLLLAVVCATTASCALAARPPAMVARAVATMPDGAAPAPGRRIAVVNVEGGEETATLGRSRVATSDFTSALVASLARAGYGAATPSDAELRLTARLTELSASSSPLSTTVTSVVQYVLTSAATGAVVFQETIRAERRVPWTRSLYGPGRLRLANEEAVRANIERLLQRLREVTGSMNR